MASSAFSDVDPLRGKHMARQFGRFGEVDSWEPLTLTFTTTFLCSIAVFFFAFFVLQFTFTFLKGRGRRRKREIVKAPIFWLVEV